MMDVHQAGENKALRVLQAYKPRLLALGMDDRRIECLRLNKAVDVLKGDRTVFIIAHRLSIVCDCDWIVFLKDEVISAIGGFYELIDKCPEFKLMASST